MKYGVVYCSYPQKLLNGTLFYGYEHCQYLRNHVDAKLYILGVTQSDYRFICDVFDQKYNIPANNVVPLNRVTDLYKLGLSTTITFDIRTFKMCKEFFTNRVLCYSNDSHDMYQYRAAREVTYFGSYDYQPHDVFSYLKLNFSIFKPSSMGDGTYISSPDMAHIRSRLRYWEEMFGAPIVTKQPSAGKGNIYDLIRAVHYVHTGKDKNNRTIPEAFWHNKHVTYERLPGVLDDSASLRFNDISANGLTNYTLDDSDPIIQACLKS